MIEVPVLISGGGPVGLTLALCLSQQGIRSLLVNERTATTTHPKLDVVNCRSMEIYRQLGLADAVRAAGNPLHANTFSAIAASGSGPVYGVMRDRHIVYRPVAEARREIAGDLDGALPLEPMQRIAQMNLEPVLLAAAQADPNIEVRFGWSLFGFEQYEDRVVAHIHAVDGGGQDQVVSGYLVGCDGPASRVRNFLNIDYDGVRDLLGELFIIHIRSSAVAALYPEGEPYWHMWLARPGFSGLLVSPDASKDDYVIHRPFPPLPGESLEDIVVAALGVAVDFEIVQAGPWRPQFLVADGFGRGRVLIAGDATHQYMPTGGLGMNTGITEAHNLAWKLAASLKGWGGPDLVDSYEAERLPVARRNRAHVKACAAAAFEANFDIADDVLDDTPSGQAARDRLAAGLTDKISRMYESLGIELGYRYEGSPVVIAEQDGPEPSPERAYIPTATPGARLPSLYREDGAPLFDALDPAGFTLLVGDAASPERFLKAADRLDVPIRVVQVGAGPARTVLAAHYVLVRPDQHVAWRGDVIEDAMAVLRTATGRLRESAHV
ncbi:Aklavinone 12-hydroxylase RdmE [Brevundimonas sp. NIBR10]|uniref:FAD-dependent monooxygenase n=1 Tax=Brevundimonas sp. NIBR10 TaxID=3015997 RepID=UPI0022F1636D|nr:FAD-dependent monooxygenase [Brevundimonas sp. NIBR10]WGM45906.1 Aklavinone 12-hydroxylase RdmE [Brevundimonas sp. NIBR10]